MGEAMRARFLFLVLASLSVNVHASDAPQASLEDELKSLTLPDNIAPSSVAREKLYAVQNRHLSLSGVSELSLGVAKNFTVDSFLVSNQVNLGYRFHLSDRWSVGLA